MRQIRYVTKSGIAVTREVHKIAYKKGLRSLLADLDSRRGVYLSSGYEFPGRYSRWDFASVRPPLEIVATGREVEFRPLNKRGEALNAMLKRVLERHPHWESFEQQGSALRGRLLPLAGLFAEEERSKQPSVFSILRALVEEFRHPDDSRLALIGAFGYDLLFQFEPIHQKIPRSGHKDLHLYFCDEVYFMDRMKEQTERYRWDFEFDGASTVGLKRSAEPVRSARVDASSASSTPPGVTSDHTPEEYMAKVEVARAGMARGDYYEVVLRQTFRAPYSGKGSDLFLRMQKASPSPYEFLIQFGDEQLVGASPEMFVRVEGARVETCPISGTARRTGDPLRDSQNIRELLDSAKEESELTMCTDVDRNDKSRVCEPGTVRVLERRLIEKIRRALSHSRSRRRHFAGEF